MGFVQVGALQSVERSQRIVVSNAVGPFWEVGKTIIDRSCKRAGTPHEVQPVPA